MPVERLQVHQHRAAGVGHVGRVHARRRPAGEVPQQPRVDRAERQLAALGARSRVLDVIEDPGDLRSRRSSVDSGSPTCSRRRSRPASPASSRTSAAVRVSCQTIALCTGSPVARSHTTVVSRWLVMPIAATSPACAPRAYERAVDHLARALPHLARVVLDPAGAGVDLRVLALVERRDLRRRRRTGSRACWSFPGRSPPRSVAIGAALRHACSRGAQSALRDPGADGAARDPRPGGGHRQRAGLPPGAPRASPCVLLRPPRDALSCDALSCIA